MDAAVAESISKKLNLLRPREPNLFGEARPLGLYERSLVTYYCGTDSTHPLLPLHYIGQLQGIDAALNVQQVVVQELRAAMHLVGPLGCDRLARCGGIRNQQLGLPVADNIALAAMRRALYYMIGEHEGSGYRHGKFMADLVAWYLGDTLIATHPLDQSGVDVVADVVWRGRYAGYAQRSVAYVLTCSRMPSSERLTTALA